jgi:hypothetical protein
MRGGKMRVLGFVAAGAMAAALGVGAADAGAASVSEGWGVQPSGANALAHSELAWQRKVAPDVYRYKYRYGPVFAGAGQNLILFGPVTVERPPSASSPTSSTRTGRCRRSRRCTRTTD